MKYLIIGNGWIGNILKSYLEDSKIAEGRVYLMSNPTEDMQNAEIWINTAAETNIDWCEKNKVRAFTENVLIAHHLAELSKDMGKKYVFFSSACIFSSNPVKKTTHSIRFFTETDKPNPQCFYTETKVMAEKLILEANPDSLIIRPRLPISEVPHPRNTLDKLSNYKFINNAQESITVIEDMLPVLKKLIETNQKGVFHLVNDGTISPAQIARKMKHKFIEDTKEEQNLRLLGEGRAQRVTSYVTSTRIPLLPHIRYRIASIVEKWKNG